MKTLNEQDFAMLCFLVLMQNDEGIVSKSPDYITEKLNMLQDGYEAIGRLDIHNMRIVVKWHELWRVELPKNVEALYRASEDAWSELARRGVHL